MLVTSYTQHEVENQLVSMLATYLGEKMSTFKDMEQKFKGMSIIFQSSYIQNFRNKF